MNLAQRFGGRLRLDYGDAPAARSPEAASWNARRKLEMMVEQDTIARDFDAIHGHFSPIKYAGLLPEARLITFVRDPYQHSLSSYAHARRMTDSHHPSFNAFAGDTPDLLTFIARYGDYQTRYLGGVALEMFEVVGVTEHYVESIRQINEALDLGLSVDPARENVNPAQVGAYPVDEAVRQAVDRHRAQDVALYRLALERLDAVRLRRKR